MNKKTKAEKFMERLSRKLPKEGKQWAAIPCRLEREKAPGAWLAANDASGRRIRVGSTDGGKTLTLCYRTRERCQHIDLEPEAVTAVIEALCCATRRPGTTTEL